jgi:arginine decarboxylase
VSSTEITEELQTSLDNMADIYHGNFSLFQSLPDVWAIDQLHPIAPIQKLDKDPNRRAVLNDITCDSDGIINKFVLRDGISNTLPVHKIENDEDYFLGVFYIGAYQETLGDLHNLFGDTPSVDVYLTKNGFKIEHALMGDSVEQVLKYVNYDKKSLLSCQEKKVSTSSLPLEDQKSFMERYRSILSNFTYLS